MIIDALLNLIVQFGQELTTIFHLPQILVLPWGIDPILVTAFGGYRLLAEYFTPLSTIISAFLIYLAFRILLLVIKMIPFIGRALD